MGLARDRYPEGCSTLRETVWLARWSSGPACPDRAVVAVLTPAETLIAARRLASG
jgi:hypothetical protein